MISFTEYLTEKLIIVGNGANYGQVIFLAGGAASGKGFAQKFIEAEKFKIFDVDALKSSFLKLAQIKAKYSELKDLNLKNPKDVFELHDWVEKRGLADAPMKALFAAAKNPDRLPNLLFDITLKSPKKINEVVPLLLELGYKPTSINIIWILANYSIAVRANADRARVVPDDILLQTHEGAAVTMASITSGQYVPHGVDGSIKVVLNDRGTTEIVKGTNAKTGEEISYLKNFTYITVKEAGKPVNKASDIQKTLLNWIRANVPKTDATKFLWGD